MRTTIKILLMAGVLFLAGTALADIPGVGVIQEARVGDPLMGSLGEQSGFGSSGMAFIGDYDGNGTQDVIAGAPSYPTDSGSLVIYKIQKNGKISGAPMVISSRDPLIKGGLYPSKNKYNGWGTGVAVAKGFSGQGSCAVVLTNMYYTPQIWALKVCMDASRSPVVSNAVVIDSHSVALTGLQMKRNGLGQSIAILDTLSTGNLIVAVGSPLDGATATSYQGRVVVLEFNPVTFDFKRRSVFPETYGSTDLIAKNLSAGERFGWSIAPIRTANGGKGMAVVSPAWVSGAQTGRVSLIMLDNSYQMISWKTVAGLSSSTNSGAPSAVSAADFDHDGNSDLVVGFKGENGVASLGEGAIQIALLDPTGTVKNTGSIKKAIGGFVDSGNALGQDAAFGATVVAGDFDQDQQVDVLVGNAGNDLGTDPANIPSSIWSLRLKALPQHKKELGNVVLTNQAGSYALKDYVIGNRLGWKILENQPVHTTIDSCAIVGQSDAAVLWCYPGKTNGSSKWMAVASDSGNVNLLDHFTDTLFFSVQVKDQDSAPVQVSAIPRIITNEEQKDTAAVIFSKYFRDPEKAPLAIALTPLNNSVTGLFSKFYLSINTDTLLFAGNPYHFGLCSLLVEVKDNAGAKIYDTLVIEVKHVNHAPIALKYSFNVEELKIDTFVVLRKDSDPDGDAVSVSVVNQPPHGVATITAGGGIRYQPTKFYLGYDSLLYAIHDKTDSGMAWVKIIVAPTTLPTSVYKPLRDTEVLESSAPISISTDSLFFNGTNRFSINAYAPKSDCQNLAVIDYVDATHRLKITPISAKWGRCQIYMRAVVSDSVASTMYLTIDSVPTPYRFSPDSVQMNLVIGTPAKLQLDSIDLDRDTMVMEAVKPLPSWIKLNRYQIQFNPVANSDDTAIYISTRKKYATGAYALPTDTLKIKVHFGSGTVYKPLRDTTVNEGSDTIFIATDSLFFWGASKFAVSDTGLKEDCKKIASVKYDDARHRLTIVPLPYQWGRCQIYLRAAVPDSLASSMFLKIDSVVSPYKFPVDTFSIFLTVDKTTSYQLDSLDKDGDTLAYSVSLSNGNPVPGWIKVNRFQIVLSPTSTDWDELKVLLQVRKKYGVGVNAMPSDTVGIFTRFGQSSAIKGRHLGGSYLSFAGGSDRMDLRSGNDAAQVEIMSLNGQVLTKTRLASNSSVSIDVSRFPHLVYLRLIEGSRTSIAPLYLHH